MKAKLKLLALSGSALVSLCIPLMAFSQSSAEVDGYGNASNINTYITHLAGTSTVPGELEVNQAKALEECGNFIINSNYATTEAVSLKMRGGKYADFRISALQQQQARCRDFAFSTTLKNKDALNLYNEAAKKQNVEAIAHNLTWGMYINKLPAAVAKAKTLQVVSSGDAAAWFTLAEALGNHGPFAQTVGHEVGAASSTYAWQLVACDHGLNCSTGSPVAIQACLSLGVCGPGGLRENLQYSGISPGTYQEVAQIENRINTAISNRTLQNLFTIN